MRNTFFIFIFCLFFAFSFNLAFAQDLPEELNSNALESQISQNKGKVVVVNFWTTTCPACQDEVKELIELRKQFESDQLMILGIAMDRSKERIRDYVQKQGINYKVYKGSRDMIYKYNVRGVPKTFFYGLQGNEEKSKAGYISFENLESTVNSLMQ